MPAPRKRAGTEDDPWFNSDVKAYLESVGIKKAVSSIRRIKPFLLPYRQLPGGIGPDGKRTQPRRYYLKADVEAYAEKIQKGSSQLAPKEQPVDDQERIEDHERIADHETRISRIERHLGL